MLRHSTPGHSPGDSYRRPSGGPDDGYGWPLDNRPPREIRSHADRDGRSLRGRDAQGRAKQSRVRKRHTKKWWVVAAALVTAPVVAGGAAMAAWGDGFINFKVVAPVTVQALGVSQENPALGQTITAGAKVVAERDVTLDSVVLAVRDQAGRQFDFPQSKYWQLGTTQKVFSASRSFSTAGTYTYWFAYKKNDRWYNLNPKQSFTVGQTTTSTPTPSPSTATPSTSPTSAPTTSPAPTTTTTAPAPTTTSGVGSGTGCASDPSKCGYPDADNTGVPAGTSLTVVSGGLTVSTSGAVIDGKEIRGCVEVRAANVTIKNSRILGNGCFYAVRNFSTGLTMSDVEITCGNSNGTGVTATNYTLIRADISGCENGLNVGGNVTMTDSWIHNLYFASGAHTDGVQVNQGAGNITFRHNTIASVQPGGTSAIIMWDEADPQNHDVLITGNLLTGGGYVLYCPRNASSNVRITNNRFGNWGYGPANSCWSPNVAEFSGNIADATGNAITF